MGYVYFREYLPTHQDSQQGSKQGLAQAPTSNSRKWGSLKRINRTKGLKSKSPFPSSHKDGSSSTSIAC